MLGLKAYATTELSVLEAEQKTRHYPHQVLPKEATCASETLSAAVNLGILPLILVISVHLRRIFSHIWHSMDLLQLLRTKMVFDAEGSTRWESMSFDNCGLPRAMSRGSHLPSFTYCREV